eukprot:snap_masked-scaffold_4-processed-gene-8.25-mRNA-1 protein AED:1.00 eAED:1.00 QI:0/0/0/0/1/1/2/0/67
MESNVKLTFIEVMNTYVDLITRPSTHVEKDFSRNQVESSKKTVIHFWQAILSKTTLKKTTNGKSTTM